jgi:hypothetical protein
MPRILVVTEYFVSCSVLLRVVRIDREILIAGSGRREGNGRGLF